MLLRDILPSMFASDFFNFGVENASATNLGGGAPEGGEPEIFSEGGDDGASGGSGDEGGDADSGSESGDDTQGDEGADGSGDQGGADGAAEGDEGGAEGDEGAEGEEGKDDEGSDEGKDDSGKTPEQIAADKKAAEEAAKTAAAKPKTEEEKLIDKTLQEAYREVPKLKEALTKYPELRAPFFKAAQLNKIYPTIQEAEKAKDWSMQLFNIDKLYFGQGADSKKALQKLLWEENLDKDGKSTGHYEQLQEIFTADTLTHLEAALTQNPTLAAAVAAGFKPEQAAVSIEVVRRLISAASGRPLTSGAGVGGGKSNAAVTALPDTTGMTPREKQLAEENARFRAQLETQTATQAQTLEKEFNEGTFKLFMDGVKPEIDKRYPPSVKGNEFYEEAFANAVVSEIHKALRADEFFDAQLEAASRSGDRGPQHRGEIADMLKQRALMLIPGISRQIADKMKAKAASAAAGAGANANNKGQNRSRGTERPRREPALGSTPGRLQKPGARTSGTPGRQSGMKTTGDYNRDADKILGLDQD